MRALMLELPEDLIADRRRRGADVWDEVWDGVLHMVPPPSPRHQSFGSQLLFVLRPIVTGLGLEISYETGVFPPGGGTPDSRFPARVVYRPEFASDRGAEEKAERGIE